MKDPYRTKDQVRGRPQGTQAQNKKHFMKSQCLKSSTRLKRKAFTE